MHEAEMKEVVQTGMDSKPAPKLVVAIASRALFDLDASHQVFEEQGDEAYARYQIEHEEMPLSPGVAFPLVCKLLALNKEGLRRVEVTLISRNSADTGLRIFNSIQHQVPFARPHGWQKETGARQTIQYNDKVTPPG